MSDMATLRRLLRELKESKSNMEYLVVQEQIMSLIDTMVDEAHFAHLKLPKEDVFVVCPNCNGDKVVRIETNAGGRYQICDSCKGYGFIKTKDVVAA